MPDPKRITSPAAPRMATVSLGSENGQRLPEVTDNHAGSRSNDNQLDKTNRLCSCNALPPLVFEHVTDILADLMLEDLKKYPRFSIGLRIDRFNERGNTAAPTQAGGE